MSLAPVQGRDALPSLPVLLLAAAWLGAALLVATVVAPAAFAVLPSRTLAGALVGRVLPVIFLAGLPVGALLAWRGRPTARGAGVLATVGCAAAQFLIGPRIEAIRRAVVGPMDALSITDARRVAFGRLHGLSVASLGLAMLAVGVATVIGSINRSPEVRP